MKPSLALILGLLCCLAVAIVSASKISPLNPTVLTQYKDIVKSQSLDLSSVSSTLSTLDALDARNILDVQLSSSEKSNLCSKVSSQLTKVTSDAELLPLSLIAESLQCKFTVNEDTLKVLNTAIASEELSSSYNGVRSLFALTTVSPASVALDNYDLIDVMRMYKDLHLPDGTTRNSVTTIAASLANTGRAAELFALALAQPSLSATILPDASSFIGQARAAASKLCDAPALKEADAVVRGVAALASAVESVVDVNFNCLVPVISSQVGATNVRNIARVLRIAKAVTAAPVHSPYFITYTLKNKDVAAENTATVSVTDAFGKKIPDSQFDLAATIDGIALVKSGKNTFSIPAQDSGSHKLVIAATAAAPAKTHITKSNSATAFLRVAANVTISKFVLSGSRSKDAVEAPLAVATPPFASAAAYAVDATDKEFLIAKVAFASSGAVPPVFSLRFSARNSKATASFPLTPASKSSAALSLALAHAATVSALGGDGVYDVTIDYVTAGADPVALPVATVTLTGLTQPVPKMDASALPRPLSHTFAPEQRIANPLITVVFIGITALPILAILYFLARFGLSAVPLATSESLTATLFLGSLAVCLVYMILYWIYMSLFTALPMLFVLSVVLIVFTHRALAASNERKGLKLVENVTVEKKNE